MKHPNPPFDVAFIRGIPFGDGEGSQLIINGLLIAPSLVKELFGSYCSQYTWGYSGSGPDCTALVVSYVLFGDKYLARELASLIFQQYVLNWPHNQPFSAEVNLINFWIDHTAAIHKADREATRLRRLDEKINASQALIQQFAPAKHLQAEKCPSTVIYGISATTYWITFPIDLPFIQSGRCRVDHYPSSQLLILTDIQEGAIQVHMESVVKTVMNKLRLNPLQMDLIQRYEWIPELIDRVSMIYYKQSDRYSDPDWASISQQQFQQVTDKAERLERQLVWTTLLIRVRIDGNYEAGRLMVILNRKPVLPLVDITGKGDYSWGVGKTELTALATELCWQLLKHSPSVQLIRPSFEEEFMWVFTEKQSFSLQLNLLDFLKKHRILLQQAGWPEWTKLR